MKWKHRNLFREADAGAGGGGSGTGENLLSAAAQQSAAAQETTSSQPPGKGYVNEDGTFAEGWHSRLPEELGEYRDTLGKKFTSVADFAKSYQGLEKLLGEKANMVKPPGKDAKPEEIAAFRKALGLPETVEAYGSFKPENLPEGLSWDDEALKPVLEIAHKHGISREAMQDLVAWQMGNELSKVEGISLLAQEQLETGTAQLRKDWGKDYDANVKLAFDAAISLGIEHPNTIAGFTDPLAVKLFAELAAKYRAAVSEDPFVKNGGGGGGMGGGQDPAALAKDIMTNPDNADHAKYRAGDKDVRAKVQDLIQRGVKAAAK